MLRHFYVYGYPAAFSPDGRFILTKTDDIYYSTGFFAAPGRDLILLRVDSPDELIKWTLANRAVGTLSCDQRAYYSIQPMCNAEEVSTGTPPATLPFITSIPSPTVTSTATTDLTRTTATPTTTITPPLPSLTTTANPVTLTVQADMTAASISTQNALQYMTVTAIALTPPLNPDDKALIGIGSHYDVLIPPTWKVWHFQGTGGEVVMIKITADPPTSETIGLIDTSFYLNGPNGLLLEYVNDFDSNHPADTVLSNYRLPATGIYTIEIHSRGFNTGGYTLTIESTGVKSSAAATATRAADIILTQTAVQQFFESLQTITLTPSNTATATSNLATVQTFTPSPTPT